LNPLSELGGPPPKFGLLDLLLGGERLIGDLLSGDLLSGDLLDVDLTGDLLAGDLRSGDRRNGDLLKGDFRESSRRGGLLDNLLIGDFEFLDNFLTGDFEGLLGETDFRFSSVFLSEFCFLSSSRDFCACSDFC
jgi:hypothetical protein